MKFFEIFAEVLVTKFTRAEVYSSGKCQFGSLAKVRDFDQELMQRWLEILDWSREYFIRMGLGDKSKSFDRFDLF